MPPDYYALLGVKPDATQRQIKSAYRKRMKEAHPDLAGHENRAEKAQREALSKQINEAYAVLSDSTARRRYNRQRRTTTTSHASSAEPSMAAVLRGLLRAGLMGLNFLFGRRRS